jgi:acyl-[acyl-carrier-protein]-phospholipid O-acyltransferase/long-chain-fatty-acid--[acyl-carrier-protein] ligase
MGNPKNPGEAESVSIPSAEHEPDSHQRGLFSASFIGLLFTQLLGAANDNVLRWLVIGIGKDFVDEENISMVLMAGTACFVLPYLLLAAPAGYLADRFSKRKVIVACKLAEILIMVLAIVAIVAQSLGMLLAVVAFMGAQSALFGAASLRCSRRNTSRPPTD